MARRRARSRRGRHGGEDHRCRFGEAGGEYLVEPAAEQHDGVGVEVALVEAGFGVGESLGVELLEVHGVCLARGTKRAHITGMMCPDTG